jgi:hypothetical protein
MTAILENGPVTYGTLTIPDQSGGKVITWDPADDAQVQEAVAAFRAAQAGGMVAHRLHSDGVAADGTMGTVIKDFEPDAHEILMRAQLVGG